MSRQLNAHADGGLRSLRPSLPPGTRTAGQPPRYRGPVARAVGTFVPRLTQKAFEKYGFSAAALLTEWSAIVGSDLAGYTRPERLKWPRGVEAYRETEPDAAGRPGATLVLRVDGPRALEVDHRRAQILERINAYFGYRAIAELRLVQAPVSSSVPIETKRPKPTGLQPRSLEVPDLAAIADEKLKSALQRLGASITGKPAR